MCRPGFALIIISFCCLLHSNPASPVSFNLNFSLDRQTYNWADSVSYARDLKPSLQLALQNRSTATLIKKSVFGEGGDRWQKTARTSASLTYNIKPSFKAGLEFSQDFDRLEKKRLIANRANLLTGFEGNHFNFSQRCGVVWEQRQFDPASSIESGLGYSGALSIKPRQDRSLGSASIEAQITTLHRTPLKNISLDYSFSANNVCGDTVTLDAKQSFGERKYFPSSGNFDVTARQRSEQRRWDLHASRILPAAVVFSTSAAYRFDKYGYDYDSAVTDLVRQNNNFASLFEYQFSLTRRFGRVLLMQGSYLYNRTKEDFGQQQTNQLAETGQLGMNAKVFLLEADTLEVSGQMGVTSYLAPTSSTFFADRDRSVNVATVRMTHRFSDFLTGMIDGSYRGFHAIYISGRLSANNNVNNVYIFNPTLIWRPLANISLQQSYQMFANYIYYEYEKSDLSGRNTLYRRANVSNKLTLTSSRRTDFVIEYSYRYEDFGPLVYSDQWQQQISWDRRTHRPRVGIDYRPIAGLRFQPYAVYEIQRSYDHLFDSTATLGRRQKSEEFTRTLVGFSFEWELSNLSHIDCTLERRVQDYQNQRNQEYNLFTISIKRFL
jgi:hypothetical protein